MSQQNTVSQETLFSKWVKSKYKLTASLEKKRNQLLKKKYMLSEHEKVNKTICNWFIDKRRQQIPIDGIIIKKKSSEFAKALGVTEFKASNCWLSNWKKR